MAGKSVNKVILIGNLGKDPEIRSTPSGTPVAKFTLATNERYKDKEGQWQDRTEWHNVVHGSTGGNCRRILEERRRRFTSKDVCRTRSWDDKQTGQKKYMTEVVANDLVLLGGRGEGGGGGDSRAARAGLPPGNNFDQRMPEAEPAAAATPISDEDIPF